METKVCKSCGVESQLSEFRQDKNGYYRRKCKKCDLELRRLWKKNNPDKERQTRKSWIEKNPDYYKDYNKNWSNKNPDYFKELCKTQGEIERKKNWRLDNPEYNKKYREENKEILKESKSRYYQENKESVKERVKKYNSEKYRTDSLFKLITCIRGLIRNSIKRGGFTKNCKTEKILDCSFEQFKIHIEEQFKEGMSWENYGEWHLDHKRPVSWGESESEIYQLNHFTNFQPLWAKDNLVKGNRFES